MNTRALCAVFLLTLTFTAPAKEHYVVSDSPELLPQSDRALVYFAHGIRLTGAFLKGRSAEMEVFVDANPIGVLPHNTYTAALVEPGFRHIYGLGWGEWVNFKPGRTYLVRLQDGLGDGFLDDPAIIRDLGFTYVTATEAGLAALRKQKWRKKYDKWRQKSWRKYQKARQKAGQSTDEALPLMMKGVAYKNKLGKLKIPGVRARGRLTVNEKQIIWTTKKKKLEIAIEDIEQASFGGLGVGAAAAWVHVRYGRAGQLQDAFFVSAVGEGYLYSHNRKFAAIMEALARSRSH